MSSFRVVIMPLAEKQLDEITTWYAEQDSAVAAEWYSGFRRRINSLADNPRQHSLAREDEYFPFELRALLYGSGRRKTHRAIFRIVGKTVEVLAIRHLVQDDLKPEDLGE